MLKKKILLIIALLLGVVGIYLIINYGFVEIVVDTSASPVNVSVASQNGTKTIRKTVESNSAKILVRRGSHEFLAKQNGASHFAIIKTAGFMKTTTIRTKLAAENYRKFVGDNPAPCMFFNGVVLLTSGCGENYYRAQVHVPSTSQLPSHTKKTDSPVEGNIEGYFSLPEKNMVLIKAPEVSEDQGSAHSLYTIAGDFGLSDGKSLTELSPSKNYSLLPYQQGFIAHDSTLEDIFYYPRAGSKADRLTFKNPSSQDLKPYVIASDETSVGVGFASSLAITDIESDKNYKSEIIIKTLGVEKDFKFEKRYATMTFCGKNKLCLLDKGRLDIYDVGGKKQKLLYSVSGVENLVATGSILLIVRSSEVINLDTVKQAGYSSYDFAGYNYCGLQTNQKGYVLCLINSSKDKVALYVDLSKTNTDSIDKKIADLIKIPEISKVSVYDRFIYISPELGDLVIDESVGGFDYKSSARSSAAKKINEQIDRLKIDRAQYTIINTLE